ncbi:MAG: fibronectin type III domain-containing protein, partial [Thermoguttaceae bacterium]|nr:fibronectin type III domain-containing protein [Thermoguttaceae bacterium]
TWTTGTLELGATYQYRVVVKNADNQAATEAVEVVVGNVPNAPNNITFGAYDEARQTLAMSWSDNSDDETNFYVEFSVNGSAWRQAEILDADVASRIATYVSPAAVYVFRVYAENVYGRSDYAEATYAPAAPAPSNVSLLVDESNVATVAWVDNSANETGFRVEISTDGKTWLPGGFAEANQQSLTLDSLEAGQTYFVRVRAENQFAVSPWTSNALTAPSDITFGVYNEAQKTLKMSWTDNSDDEVRFRVEYSVNGGRWLLAANLASNARTATYVQVGNAYSFRVRAENAYGVSEWSEVATYIAEATAETESEALLTSEAFADFDEFDFFGDEDELDALAKRLI